MKFAPSRESIVTFQISLPFLRDKDSDGYETGRHKLYRYKMNEASPVIEDLLANVPEKNNVEILDYSIGDSYLYFTGVSGVSIMGGRINISDYSYTPFNAKTLDARLTEVEVY